MPATSLPKEALRHFLAVYQERKVFGMFWVNPSTIPYDIPTENTRLAAFISVSYTHLTLPTNSRV